MAEAEEIRAAAFRQQQMTREAAIRARERRLTGSAAARTVLRNAWRPWTDPQPSVVEPHDSELVN